MLTGTAPRLYYDASAAQWKLVVEATMFVTYATVVVWSGVKAAGNDPTGAYTRSAGCDLTAMFSVEAV